MGGHLNATVAVGHAVVNRGHEQRWMVTGAGLVRLLGRHRWVDVGHVEFLTAIFGLVVGRGQKHVVIVLVGRRSRLERRQQRFNVGVLVGFFTGDHQRHGVTRLHHDGASTFLLVRPNQPINQTDF